VVNHRQAEGNGGGAVSYIRRKNVGDRTYYDVVESYREKGKVKQRLIVALGRCSTIDDAIEETEWWIKQYTHNATLSGGRQVFAPEGGGLLTLVVGKEAQHRAEKLKRKLGKLKSLVVRNCVVVGVTDSYYRPAEVRR
jgi:hypothetical protein